MRNISLCLFGFVAFLAVPAKAAYFDFTNQHISGKSAFIWDVSNTHKLQVKAVTLKNSTLKNNRFLSGSSHGLGVWGGFGDSAQVDGKGRDEGLLIRFSQPVNIVSAKFGAIDHGDDADYYVDFFGSASGLIHEGNIKLDKLTDGTKIFQSLTNVSDILFMAHGKRDDFRLKGLQIAQVSLPSAIGLFASVLLFAGIARRLKK